MKLVTLGSEKVIMTVTVVSHCFNSAHWRFHLSTLVTQLNDAFTQNKMVLDFMHPFGELSMEEDVDVACERKYFTETLALFRCPFIHLTG